MSIIIPKGYKSVLDPRMTERAIKFVKDSFERELASELRLSRVTSPRFVKANSGINDDLNGIERPVRFNVGNMNEQSMEIVQSLAKWKRMALADLGFCPGTGIYTDMDAIRPDDDIDNIHSIYVDQWDWERVMAPEERNLDFLKKIASGVYEVIKRTEFLVSQNYPSCAQALPEHIKFIHAEEAREMLPNLSPVEREKKLSKQFGAIFIIGIGMPLSDGVMHGGRAPDYDDWSTKNADGFYGLNGDIIVWDSVRQDSLELSSMGIRVSPQSLLEQLKIRNCEKRAELYWHQRLLAGEYPQTIGGGIGQSRICMFLLKKAHIGEVQASVWPDEDRNAAKKAGINLM